MYCTALFVPGVLTQLAACVCFGHMRPPSECLKSENEDCGHQSLSAVDTVTPVGTQFPFSSLARIRNPHHRSPPSPLCCFVLCIPAVGVHSHEAHGWTCDSSDTMTGEMPCSLDWYHICVTHQHANILCVCTSVCAGAHLRTCARAGAASRLQCVSVSANGFCLGSCS